ncbi:tripartite tricarboxylate transporter substrate binding protein [Ramlibacter sp. Leaf400]|uniref:tripartite tricarboxylate transporter substrate binding protein n=1 Tax=Ramlibacter sp. Leaf400 TaxID=1736365 RepID=UPI0006F1ECC1|nr:tripartite tricarboxylate transporter substrate binding protein [Ramlibacter sp. Leaf400]KQT09437.1 ABC transporter substrate-binding protein [Ramlibacter sp. Leaf400]
MNLKNCLTALGAVLLSTAALAQSGKTVSLVIPYPAGGLADVIARGVAPVLSKHLNQTVVVDNVAGVSGTLAAQKVLNAPADGMFILQGSPNEVILPPLAMSAVRLRSEDFRVVQLIGIAPMVLVVRHDLPANTIDEFVALARSSARTKPLTYGSTGIGSFYHLLGEQLSKVTGAEMLHVPYKGGAPLLQDMGGGQLDFALLPFAQQYVALAQQKRMKILGTLAETRPESLKQYPTVNEGTALKNFSFDIWTSYMVRRDTPEEVVVRLNRALTEALAEPSVKTVLDAQSLLPAKQVTAVEGVRMYDAEIKRFRELARNINLKPQ